MAFYRIGGLWLKRDRKNRLYFTGALVIGGEKLHVSIYMNEKKEAEKHPDWFVYEQKIDRKCRK